MHLNPQWLKLIRSKVVVLLLLIYCLMHFPLFVGDVCLSLFYFALLCVHSRFAIILKRKRKLVALLLLSYRCIVTVNVLLLFLTVPWVGLQYMIVVFHDTHLHFGYGCFTFIVFLMSYDCHCIVTLPHGAVGWSAVCDCGIF